MFSPAEDHEDNLILLFAFDCGGIADGLRVADNIPSVQRSEAAHFVHVPGRKGFWSTVAISIEESDARKKGRTYGKRIES